jgi:hypothetical protein
MDGTKIQESQLGTESEDSIIGTKIWNTLIQTENGEDPTWTKILTIGSKTKNGMLTKNLRSKTKIWDSKQTIEI